MTKKQVLEIIDHNKEFVTRLMKEENQHLIEAFCVILKSDIESVEE